MSITSDEIVDAMIERNKNIQAVYGIHGVTEPFTINSTNVFRYKYQVHGRTQWLFYINSIREGVPTQSSQFTPELFYCRSIRSVPTENKAKMHNVTHPISNSQSFSERILYHKDVFQKVEKSRLCGR